MEELTTEQLELQEEKQHREKLKYDIRMGKALEKLKKTPEFKELIEGVFLENGKTILWQNVQYLTEEQMKGRGNEKNIEVLDAIKGQIKTRLDFEGFMDTVQNDYEMAIEDQQDLDRKTA